MAALKCLYCHIVKRLTLQNTNLNCFAIINNRVKVLHSKSVVPIKTRFAHGKWHSALHECLALMTLSKTHRYLIRNFQQTASNSIRNDTCLKLSPFELKLQGIKCFSILPGVRSFHLEFLENCCLASRLCTHLNVTS